ncbi:ankyrin repeat-containing domain protein [Cadophora sp. MPI-SDFR-AT-0126]|nr:ankyrin repeat-containing domain protein [Leotiomycetes sp. MPI-SDFR-AT-0126]
MDNKDRYGRRYSQFHDDWEPEPPLPLPLYAAASSGDHTELERLLKISNDMVNQRDKYPSYYPSSTALEVAIRKNDITSVKLLLDHGAGPELRLLWSEQNIMSQATSVCEAAALGFLDILRLMIDKGGRVTSVLLYSAADFVQLECVKEVFAWLVMIPELDQDEFPRPRRNCVRRGPFEDARRKRIEVVRMLLEAEADVEAISRYDDYYYMKQLHQMAREGNRAREIFDMLLDRGAEVNSVNREDSRYNNGQTPLCQATLADYFVERLLEKGARIAHVDKDGNTLLHASASNFTPACLEIVSLLLRHGISAYTRKLRGMTALHEASNLGSVEVVRFLLASNRDLVTCKTPLGWTALHFAASTTAAIDIAALLLKYGGNINEPTAEGWAVLQLAVASNPDGASDMTAFISYLFGNGADIAMTEYLRDPGLVWPVHFLPGPSTSRVSRESGVVWQPRDSLLHLAFDKRYYGSSTHLATIRVLLDNNANMEFRDAQGRTPLLRAIGMWESNEKFHRVTRAQRVV